MKRYYIIACALCLVPAFGTANSNNALSQTSGEPEPPRMFLSTSYPTVTGRMINVSAGGNLQSALDNAQAGDTLVLQAGAVFTGNFILPSKAGNEWIVIRTSNLSNISSEGIRVSANQAGAMPKIVTANAAPALATAPGAHHYRFVGLEIGIAAAVTINYGIVSFGDGSQSSLSLTPHDLTIDRCYIHGNPTGNVSRGVAFNSASTAVVDSYISECHGVGFDTQAIAGWNGPGPFKIAGNYLEAAGENVMFGGADPRVTDLVPSDIEFRRNYCFKPLSWNPAHASYGGVHWSVKNLFELKNAQRVLIDGNVFEHSWVDAQTGFIIVFTPRNQEGTAPWSVVQDVIFTNNIGRHAAAGIQFLGHDNNYPSQQEQRIKIRNNLFHDVGGSEWGGNGRLFQLVDGTADVHIDHNTAMHTSNIVTADGTPNTGFVYTNNITPHNDYGFMGSGRSIGNDSIGYYFPGCSLTKNVIIGGPAGAYPTGNFFPASINDVLFTDLSNDNYRLADGSPYKNAGTDGRDIGVDQDAVVAAIGGEQLPPSPGNQIPHVSITTSVTQGAAPLSVGLTADAFDPDGSIAAYAWDFGDGQVSSLSSVSHVYQTAGTFNARVTVTDNLGAVATASIVVSVTSPPLPAGSEIVLYASGAPVRVGAWSQVTDATAAGGKCLWNSDSGAPKLTTPLANPPDYFEMTFSVVAGRPYRLWIRGKAQSDSPYNDSVFIQFSGTVDTAGASVFRIGSTDATIMNLEDCLGCGLQGWGWQDNGWGVGVMGPLIYFSNSGTQTLRAQAREDGLMIDQIVLSPETYLSAAPGALKNDATILPESVGLSVTTISAAMPSSGATSGGTYFVISGGGFASGASVIVGGTPATSVQVQSASSIAAVTPAHLAGAVDVVVINTDGRTGTLLGGYTYVAPNQPPRVSITASSTSGVAPATVGLTANASDPDGTITGYNWDFGDGQTSTLAVASHIYQSAGTYNARVTVTDNVGATATAAVTITVSAPNQPPQVSITASTKSGVAPLLVWLTANASDSDGTITGYNWDFGDGQTSTLSVASHVYQSAGTYNARVTVTDNVGATATAAVTITVSAPNQPPQVSITAATTSGVAPLAVGLTANASDPDGTIAGYKWDFGDGQASTQAVASHVYQLPGTYNARVTVTDNAAATSTASIAITVLAPPPSVRVLSPNGGETLPFDAACVVTWSVSGGSPSRQDVYLSLNGGSTWTALASGLPGTVSSYNWRAPRTATTTARIRVRVWDAGGTAVEDMSDRDFAIQKKLNR